MSENSENIMDDGRDKWRNSTLESRTKRSPSVSSPDMFVSDKESEAHERDVDSASPTTSSTRASPLRPSQADLVTKSDDYLLARINKFLSGVPPPPRLTICRSDCNDFLLHIRQNQKLLWSDCPAPSSDARFTKRASSLHQQREEKTEHQCCDNSHPSQRARIAPRNLTSAFDACDVSVELSVDSSVAAEQSNTQYTDDRDDSHKRPYPPTYSNSPQQFLSLYQTIDEKEATSLPWPEAYRHKCQGIHYNRNRAVEEFEGLTLKLCERYVGAETQSTCNVWFSKQTPGSARKRSLLAKRETGQSPGKRLSHLARRRRTFSSANLQGLGLVDKKQLLLNVNCRKVTTAAAMCKKGKSPRGKSPRGSAKKRAVRRLTLDGPSPRKVRLESSKRALFQSPPTEGRAGPSKLFNVNSFNGSNNQSNPKSIKRALFPAPKKQSNEKEEKEKEEQEEQEEPLLKKSAVKEETRKRKREEDEDGNDKGDNDDNDDNEAKAPKFKWAKSLSFDCTHELQNSSLSCWSKEKNLSAHVLSKDNASAVIRASRSELSDTHRKKLLWAVAEALRSKGIGMGHPLFKQYASNLARTVKKFMPDLENRNVPRKPGSTSDRMLKLAKYHVLFVVEASSTE